VEKMYTLPWSVPHTITEAFSAKVPSLTHLFLLGMANVWDGEERGKSYKSKPFDMLSTSNNLPE